MISTIRVIDSHTGGEPTRVVVSGGPVLCGSGIAEQWRIFRAEHDGFRSAVVNEPRGSDVLVGALLLEPTAPLSTAGVIFFNNVSALQMCGHGTIGVIVTLAHLGRIGPGVHVLETVAGTVAATLHEDGRVSVENVLSYRRARAVKIDVPGVGPITGDVAWGGNWFFLVEQEETLADVAQLTDFAKRLRGAVNAQGFPEVDHIELSGPPAQPGTHSRNFVLCPGGAYDRSPCGTGTSAKMACLFAEGKLREGEVWRQESITGSVFEGTVQAADGGVIPTITGTAYITAEASLLLDPQDPLCWGMRAL